MIKFKIYIPLLNIIINCKREQNFMCALFLCVSFVLSDI